MTFVSEAINNTRVTIIRRAVGVSAGVPTVTVTKKENIPAFLDDGSATLPFEFMFTAEYERGFLMLPSEIEVHTGDIIEDERPNQGAANEGKPQIYTVSSVRRIRGPLHNVISIQCQLEETKGSEAAIRAI